MPEATDYFPQLSRLNPSRRPEIKDCRSWRTESDDGAGGSVVPHPGGASVFRLLLLSVTRFHMELRVTRAMSNVMLKLRRYHSLQEDRHDFTDVC